MKWAWENDSGHNGNYEDMCEYAAQGGHPEVLKWLHEQGCDWNDRMMCGTAAGAGHLEVLKYVREEGCECDWSVCMFAAKRGHLEVLQWLWDNDCRWTDDGNDRMCHEAAAGGHLEVLQWARAHDCPWNERTCAEAALRGHLEVLKWARAQGRAVQVDPTKLKLKPPGTKRWKPTCDIMLSNCAFKFNLRRYTQAARGMRDVAHKSLMSERTRRWRVGSGLKSRTSNGGL